MDNNERFIEVGKMKAVIAQLQSEVDAHELEIKKTFRDDVKEFFLSKCFEFMTPDKYGRNGNNFINLREIDKRSTFRVGREPKYYISGKNHLTIRFEWHLKCNSSVSQVYWYPEKQTLEDFYNRRLKKTLILPLKVERKNKLEKLKMTQ